MSDKEDYDDDNVDDHDDSQLEDDDMEEGEGDIEILQEDHTTSGKGKKIAEEDRCSVPFLTKYERARILGTRALQISKNADLLVDPGVETDPYKIAEMEL